MSMATNKYFNFSRVSQRQHAAVSEIRYYSEKLLKFIDKEIPNTNLGKKAKAMVKDGLKLCNSSIVFDKTPKFDY